ncbi:uncharacterized protein [Watersipora subatra]|uniref:uncharacterized protein n=1 Tax=Watersipora subatra TaxID=2589382 RepID=UPI00355B86C3
MPGMPLACSKIQLLRFTEWTTKKMQALPNIPPPPGYLRIIKSLLGPGNSPLLLTLYGKLFLINQWVGSKEVQEFAEILDSIFRLTGKICGAQTFKFTSAGSFISFLNDAANTLFFANHEVTWEGISKLLLFTTEVVHSSLLQSNISNQETVAIKWCLNYIWQPKSGIYPGIQSFIDQEGWEAVNDYEDYLHSLPVLARVGGDAAHTELCKCLPGYVRKDNFADPRFPYNCCPHCLKFWCRIELCRFTCTDLMQLIQHQYRCHNHPLKQAIPYRAYSSKTSSN